MLNSTTIMQTEDIYVDYPFEEVMYRRLHKSKVINVKFYGEEESERVVEFSNNLYCHAILYGDRITQEEYEKGKPRDMEHPMSSDLLTKAISLACLAHTDQIDKAGEPYILHPLRLMMQMNSLDERIVAVLHDAIEDSEMTLENLIDEGLENSCILAIDCLTKRGGEVYDGFIRRLSGNELARKVKIADLRDNMNLERLENVTDIDLKRVEKYKKALEYLTSL